MLLARDIQISKTRIYSLNSSLFFFYLVKLKPNYNETLQFTTNQAFTRKEFLNYKTHSKHITEAKFIIKFENSLNNQLIRFAISNALSRQSKGN